MENVRVVSFDGLLNRLRQILDEDCLLLQRFEFALTHKDENAIDAAMQSLHIYPKETRDAIENAMLAWLFNQNDQETLANLSAPSNQLN